MQRAVGWLLVVLALIGIPVVACAQADSELRVMLGAGGDAHTDRLASPLRHSGWGLGGGIEYARPRLSIEVRASALEATSALHDEVGSFEDVWSAGLHARYLVPAGRLGEVDAYWGVGLGALALVRRHHYPQLQTGGTELFADMVVPLSAIAAFEWTEGDVRVQERLELGVAVGAFASPFVGAKFFPSASVRGPWSAQVASHRLAVTVPLSERVVVRVEHRAQVVALERVRSFRHLRQEVTAGFGIVWGGS